MVLAKEFLAAILFIYIVLTIINLSYDGDVFEGLGKNVNRYENVLISVSLVIASALFGLAAFETGTCIKMLGIYSAVCSIFYYASGIVYIVDKEFQIESKLPIQGILNLVVGGMLTYFGYRLILKRGEYAEIERKNYIKAAYAEIEAEARRQQKPPA